LRAANWAAESTFRQFYNRELSAVSFLRLFWHLKQILIRRFKVTVEDGVWTYECNLKLHEVA
jgi:hypothetical protein